MATPQLTGGTGTQRGLGIADFLTPYQWRNPMWSIPVNEQVALRTEQVALPSE